MKGMVMPEFIQCVSAVICRFEYKPTRKKYVLLVRTRGKEAWTVPGGKVNPGERYREALWRELREELGIIIRHSNWSDDYITLSFFDNLIGKSISGNDIRVAVWSGHYFDHMAKKETEVKPLNEIEEVKWVEIQECFQMNLSPMTRNIIQALQKKGRI